MKRNLLVVLAAFLLLFNTKEAKAVLPAGSDATDFTVTDLNGQSYNLFSLLNSGVTVYLDFSATWCAPCWAYHNSGALENLYNNYGPNGTGEVMVFMIEAELNNNLACLYGSSGCVGPNGGTQGNWVAGTPYPIIDLLQSQASIRTNYAITYFPTIYCICPQTKKVYESSQVSTSVQYSYVSSCALDYVIDEVKNSGCNGGNDGSIKISTVKGTAPFTYTWSNGAYTQDVYGLDAGDYSVTVTDAHGIKIESTTVSITEPDALIIDDQVTDAGCVGQTGGSVNVDVSGGTGGYKYKWSTGATVDHISNLGAGVYALTVTDDGTCKKIFNYTIDAEPNPDVDAGEDAFVNCIHPIQNLEGDGEFGPDFSYQWTTVGGHIVSGSNTLNPEVDKAGTYKLVITNNSTGCHSEDATFVTANFTPAVANIAGDGTLNCQNTQTVLNGSSSSSGNNFVYNWTTNNGHVVSGGNTNSATVDQGGTYKLIVTHNLSGCTGSDEAVVVQNNQSPTAVVQPANPINCANNTVTLDGTQSTTGTGITYSWFTTGGSIVSGEQTTSPVVSSGGTYYLVVHNSLSLCNDTSSVTVAQDGNLPVSNAGPAAELNCNTSTLQLNGSQSTQGSNISIQWTTPNGNIVSGGNTYTPVIDNAGSYTLVITNTENGCSAISTVNISQNPSSVPTATYSYTADLLTVGFVDASTGLPSTYLWNFGDGNTSTEKDPVHVYAIDGSYNVCLTITNICGTSTTCQTFNVTGNTNIPSISNIGITNATCHGSSDGCIDVSVIYGTAPYTYTWSNGVTTEDPCGMPAGSYSVTVTDANGVSVVSNNIVVTESYFINVDKSVKTQPACNLSNGAISVDVNSNGGQLSYVWSHDPNLNSNVAENLSEGNYNVIITDEHGCSTETTINLLDKGQRISSKSDEVLCFGNNTGSIDLSTTGGTAPYTYSWNSGQTTEDLSNVVAGTYICQVTDADGCVKSVEVIISEPSDIETTINVVNSQVGKDNGSATANPTGGVAPYTYLWNNGLNTQTITNLAPGDYNVIVTDANGCKKTYIVTVAEVVGTTTLSILNNIALYPNPTNGNFTIVAQFSEVVTSDLTVVDLLGKVIYKKRFEGQEINEPIDLSSYPAGNYFVRISTTKGQHTEKLNVVK